MMESSDEAAIVKRANWVGLRTIRQRPKVVAHTKTGEPIFEARSARLILRGDSTHFNRLVRCVRCSEEVVGFSVRSPTDLDRAMNTVICKDCVRSASMPGQQQPARSVGEPEHHVVVERPSTRLADARATQESAGATAEVTEEIRGLDQANREAAHTRADFERRLADMAQQMGSLHARFDEAMEEVHEIRLGTVAELREENEHFRRAQSEQLDQLRQDLAREHTDSELSRTREQLNERLDGLAGWLAQVAQPDEERAGAIEAKVAAAIEARLEAREGEHHASRESALQEVGDALAKSAKALRERVDRVEAVSTRLAEAQREGMAALRREMAETQTAVPAETNDGERLNTLEQALARRETEVSDLFDFHAALDAGMGELRSELARLRSSTSSLADAQADIQERLDDIVVAPRSQTPEVSPTRRRRESRKTEVANEAAAALAIDELARHQQRIDSQLARLEETIAGATLAASTHASSQASALGPIRSDVKALHEQLVAQQDVIASLRKSVETLRRKVSVPAPAAAKKTARSKP